jgi:hypothetical protein
MFTVIHRWSPAPSWRSCRSVRLNAATALLLSRAVWRMYRGRWPWSTGGRLRG